MNKRSLVFILIALLLLGLLPVSAQEATETPIEKADGIFPVTINHQYGSTTITQEPKRVVAIGYTEQDLLLAVGVTPVAARYWYGDEKSVIFPWAKNKLTGDEPIVLNMPFGNLNYEAILALKPDLISGVTAGITKEEYDTLSTIAPTITQTSDYINFGIPWQVATQMVGDAVGKSATAAKAVADVEALFEEARAQNPQFEGKSVAVSYFSQGTYGFYTSQDSRGRFFSDLGFIVPQDLVDLAGTSFYANVSEEQVGLLDRDLIAIVNLQFIDGGRDALKAEPLFSKLNAVKEGRVAYFDTETENAIGFSSPLSLPFALKNVLPQLESIFPNAEQTPEATEAASS